MSLLFPALQKFYNALKNLEKFSIENSFFDNIGCIDTFFTEYRSTTFMLQKSLGGNNHPVYTSNLNKYLLADGSLSKWFIDQRNNVNHEHPFKLKKNLRVIIYMSGNAVEFEKYDQTAEQEESFGDYLFAIRNSLMSITSPEIYFSVQYLFVDEQDSKEISIFDFIDKGLIAMWQFLHAMKVDLKDEGDLANKMMGKIDSLIESMPQRWMIDVIDYCYYRSEDCFERGESVTMMMPDIRIPIDIFLQQARKMSNTIRTFYDAFIYLHALAYIQQNHNIMSAFFVEYEDGTYQTIAFAATIRTTMYRYINRVANLVSDNNVVNVYLVTETVSYGGFDKKSFNKFLQLDYKEKKAYRTKTHLSFYKVTQIGEIEPVIIDADALVDRLSVSMAMGNRNNSKVNFLYNVMLTPIVKSFKKKLEIVTREKV